MLQGKNIILYDIPWGHEQTAAFGQGELGIGFYVTSAIMNQGLQLHARFDVVFLFHEQKPFHKKKIADLYNSICTDEVEHWHKLSEIAWDLLTQVDGRSAEYNSFSFRKLMIIYIQRELSL